MKRRYREVSFDALLTIASALSISAFLGQLSIEPPTAVGIAIVVVLVGLYIIVPRSGRRQAGLLALIYGGLAGVVIPWAVTSINTLPVGDESRTTFLLCGLVLLLLFAHLRVTTFRPRDSPRRTRHRV